jgi:hypothetical protein
MSVGAFSSKPRFSRPRIHGASGLIEVPLRTEVDAATKAAFIRLARTRKPNGTASERSAAAFLRELVEREISMHHILRETALNLPTKKQ